MVKVTSSDLGNIVGIIISGVIVMFVVTLLEEALLNQFINLPQNITIDQWMASFELAARITTAIAFVLALTWYIVCRWFKHVRDYPSADTGWFWWFLLIVSLLAAGLLSWLLVYPAEEGSWLVYLLNLVNVILAFYLPTLLFSPNSVKYAPPGASRVRSW